MNREDIARMMRDSHLNVYGLSKDHEKFFTVIERFAVLVASAERERLATKFMEIHEAQKHNNNYWHFAARKIREEV